MALNELNLEMEYLLPAKQIEADVLMPIEYSEILCFVETKNYN